MKINKKKIKKGIEIMKINKKKIKNAELHSLCTEENGFISITFEYENEKYEIQAYVGLVNSSVNQEFVKKFGYKNMMNVFYSKLKKCDSIKII